MRNPSDLRFEDVSKHYGAVTAVRNVSFTISAGELVTLLGPSGCGKTTTLRMIAGLEIPSSGRVLIGEHDVTRLPATARDVAMVFQSYALFPHMSVGDNVGYGLTVSGRPRAEVRERVESALALVGLQGLGKRLPAELSGGQQQRVAVARAVILEPEVLLFDEPLSNLDAKLRRYVREEIRELQKKLSITTVYVTHDQAEALAVSDRIIVMNQATIAQNGTPRELYDEPVSRFVADFVGEANLLPVMVEQVINGRASVRLGPLRLDLPCRDLVVGAGTMAVRPHAVRLAVEPAPDALPVVVAKATYLGSHIEYEVESEAGTLLVVDPDVRRTLSVRSSAFARFSGHGICLVGR